MAKVGCAGILVADTFCGPMPRLPAPGELLAIEEMQSSPGGCAANVAIDLVKQDISADILGCVGNDALADSLLHGLRENDVNCERVVRSRQYSTSRTVILLVDGEDRRYLHDFGANRDLAISHIPHDWIDSLEVFYLGGLFAMPGIALDELADLFAYCRQQKVTTVLDVVVPQSFDRGADISVCQDTHENLAPGRQACLPHDSLSRLLPYVDFFLPNSDEAYRLTGQLQPREQLRSLLKLGAHSVIVTCGAAGCIASDGQQIWECGTFEMNSIDPSGSGDAFASGVITGILRKWPMPEILQYATALGASATRAIGTTASVFDAKQASDYLSSCVLKIRSEPLAEVAHLHGGRT
jgi:sugar/nucleoside kinase (ribokinase family)